MTPRRLRNIAFDAATPAFIKKHYPAHGRVIGNALSYSRELEAPALFITSAIGIKGRFPGIMRVLKMVGDGYDGFAAEQDRDFDTSKPTLAGLKQLREAIWVHGQPVIRSLRETAGGPLDHEADQIAQISDQAGNVLHSDLDFGYLLLNGFRNRTMRKIRGYYKSLNVTSAAKSRPAGQIKTVIMDSHQTAESFGVLDRMPWLRRPLSLLGKVAIAYSFFDAVGSMEKNYLSNEYDTSELGSLQAFALGCARYGTRNMENVEVYPSYLARIEPLDVGAEAAI